MRDFGLFIVALVVSANGLRAQEPPLQPAPDAGAYVIGIEDVLHVSVWGETALNLNVRVRPDGRISFPLVNDIRAEGLSPDQLRSALIQKLSAFIRDPNVTVIVEQINSFRVYVLGEVTTQGVLSFTRPTKLLQALASAGGLTEFSKKDVVIVRDRAGSEQRIRVDYKKLLSGEGLQENVALQPGDIILVN